jgi:5-methylcytosine-specific restriction protein B
MTPMIGDADRDTLLKAMEQFDRELRSTSEWAKWEENENHKFAIDWNGRRYPVKQIVSMATGTERTSFSGGPEANGYLAKRGIPVVRLRADDRGEGSLRSELETVLATYKDARTEQFGKQHPMWATFDRLQDLLQASAPVRARGDLAVGWSAGMGNWARVPWISFLDHRETATTQRGVYCVYLFREDLSGVYLTFNQGVTEPKRERKSEGAREFLRQNAISLRSLCKPLTSRGFQLDDSIDLHVDAGLGADYENSTIAYKFYGAGAIPDDSTLTADLEAVLSAYDRYLDRQHRPVAPVSADLEAIVRAFSAALRECDLVFGSNHEQFVRTFLASLATKRFVILTGLSGSGKTQIAARFGEWLGGDKLRIVPVRPDWTGAEALFGYEDALLPVLNGKRAWHVPAPLRFMLEAASNTSQPYLLVLDEMNLAHVERYFADFLSGLESGHTCLPNLKEGEDGCWRLRDEAQREVRVPDNLFVVGTVNVDDTTYMFSPKVLDRANTIEFRVLTTDFSAESRKPGHCQPGDPSLVRGFLAIATDEAWHINHPAPEMSRFCDELRKVHSLLTEAGLEFGHRVFYEATRFAAMLAAAGDADPEHSLDIQILQKLLPRLHGSRRKLEPTLVALAQYCASSQLPVPGERFDPLASRPALARLPRSFDKLARMVRNVRANQFTSFTE